MISSIKKYFIKALYDEYHNLILWVPVFWAIGISIYFSFDFEPPLAISLSVLIILLSSLFFFHNKYFTSLLITALLLICLGFLNAKIKYLTIDNNIILKKTLPLKLSGYVEAIEYKQNNGMRLKIEPYEIEDYIENNLPNLLFISLRKSDDRLVVGHDISLKVMLLPPPEPVIPKGFDYARLVWFDGISGIGFNVSAIEINGFKEMGIAEKLLNVIENLRHNIINSVNSELDTNTALIANALITGERRAISDELNEDIRNSGLAHILAISGLHLGIVCGTFFILLRMMLIFFTPLLGKLNIKIFAALMTIPVGFFYLLLSGNSIATKRAFIMISVMMMAIVFKRSAITLRNLAIAALIVLVLNPESLLNVSFHMSFAAVIAIISLFELFSNRLYFKLDNSDKEVSPTYIYLQKLGNYLLIIILTTLIASFATAPYVIYHFQKVALYSLLANIAVLPVLSIIVMPFLLISVIFMPIHLEAVPLNIAAYGIDFLIYSAQEVSHLPNSTLNTGATNFWGLIILSIGGLWLFLWNKKIRYLGLGIIILGGIIMSFHNKYDILISREGGNVAFRNERGKLIFHNNKKDKYSIDIWQRYNGDNVDNEVTGRNDVFKCDISACSFNVKDRKISYLFEISAFLEDCYKADLIITYFYLRENCPNNTPVITKGDLYSNGSYGIYINGDGRFEFDYVNKYRGKRAWVTAIRN